MSKYRFSGVPPFVADVARSRGWNESDSRDPRTVIGHGAKTHPILLKIQDALSQADQATSKDRPAVAKRAVDLCWLLGVLKESAEQATLEFYTHHELDVSELMKVIDHGTGHSNGDDDHGLVDDMGSIESGAREGDPRQIGISKRRKG